jgi:hypothetical protein
LDLDKLLKQAYVILESAVLESSANEEAAIPEPPNKELKPLLETLKYKFLGLAESLPVIIASYLASA